MLAETTSLFNDSSVFSLPFFYLSNCSILGHRRSSQCLLWLTPSPPVTLNPFCPALCRPVVFGGVHQRCQEWPIHRPTATVRSGSRSPVLRTRDIDGQAHTFFSSGFLLLSWSLPSTALLFSFWPTLHSLIVYISLLWLCGSSSVDPDVLWELHHFLYKCFSEASLRWKLFKKKKRKKVP